MSQPGTRANATVLLADDEPAVRRVARRVLEELGYRVIESRDGQEAVERFCEHCDEIALALLDFHMPRRDGLQALAAMRSLVPGLPAIVMSGDWDRSGAGAPTVEATLLAKPFPRSRLVSSVQLATAATPAFGSPPAPDQAV